MSVLSKLLNSLQHTKCTMVKRVGPKGSSPYKISSNTSTHSQAPKPISLIRGVV